MFKVAIIEDEILARDTLKVYLKKYFSDLIISAEIDSVRDAINYLSNNTVDILFLDVQLKDGKALEILNKINSSKYRIIFTTAFDDYALEAFKHKSFGYLLKPIDVNDFKEIVSRVLKDLSAKLEPTQMQLKLRISIPDGHQWIEHSDIIRCESESNYTKIFTNRTGRTYVVSRTLKSIEQELKQSVDFIRVHQSHLVNLSYVGEFALRNNFLRLRSGDQIPVSRRMKQELLMRWNLK